LFVGLIVLPGDYSSAAKITITHASKVACGSSGGPSLRRRPWCCW